MLVDEVPDCVAAMVHVEGLEVLMAAIGGLIGQRTPATPWTS
jgi:hypothetical protein